MHGSFNSIGHKVLMKNVSFDTNMDICHLKNMLEHGYFRCKKSNIYKRINYTNLF